MVVWGIAGSAGMAAQVRALASALSLDVEMKNVALKKPFAWLPNIIYSGALQKLVIPYALARGSDNLAPPWPDLVISCGRRAAIVAMGLRARAGAKTKFIHIQDPQTSPKYFDVVVAMAHDKITGGNVIKTRFALHAITPEALAESAARFAPRFANYSKPRVAVLIGGSTNKYTLSEAGMGKIIVALRRLLAQGSLLITPSRRTGETNVALLKRAFAGMPYSYVYDFSDENPYLGLLALADVIIVTNDSVNMMSEAAATGKPMYILPLPEHVDTKPARFAEGLIRDGIARTLGDKLETWTYPVSDEMEKLTKEIRKRLAL